MFDNLDYSKQDASIAKVEAQGFTYFGQERSPKGSKQYRKGNRGKSVSYDGTIEDMNFNFKEYDKQTKRFSENMEMLDNIKDVSGIAPPFGSAEVVYSDTGSIQKGVTNVAKVAVLIGIGAGLYYLLQK